MTDTQPRVNPTTGDIDETVQVRPFADWLREQSQGKSHDELSDGLHDLIERVMDTGKKGSLVYIVTVAPLKDSADILAVSDEIKLKLPEHDRNASIFYPDRNGNLTRRDPRQQEIDWAALREVPAPTTDPTTAKEAH